MLTLPTEFLTGNGVKYKVFAGGVLFIGEDEEFVMITLKDLLEIAKVAGRIRTQEKLAKMICNMKEEKSGS